MSPGPYARSVTATPVDFFLDPGCPFTWRTSRWLTAVEDAGEAEVTWRLMSLSVLNEGRDIPEQYATEVGLPESVADALDDPARDASVRASHDRAQQLVGDDAGSPVLALEGRGFFGPVVVPVPKGEEALDLFRGVRLLAGVAAFSELKTSRNDF